MVRCSWRASLGPIVAGQSKGSWRLELSWASSLLVCGRKWFQLFFGFPQHFTRVCVLCACVHRWACTQVCVWGGMRVFFFLSLPLGSPPHSLKHGLSIEPRSSLIALAILLEGSPVCLPSTVILGGQPHPPRMHTGS